MTVANLQDDNLRLLFSRQELTYLVDEISYHKTSLIYCGLVYAGFFLFGMLCPLILVIAPNSISFLFIIGFLLGLVVFCTTLMVVPILLQVIKYKKMMQDHKEFMRKYNRLE